MLRIAKILLIATVIALILWILPWSFRFLTTSSHKTPFTLYSSIVNDFAMIENVDKEINYKDLSGNKYTASQFDSILPTFYYRQLIADERLPDSLHGIAVSPRLIQTENFIFRSTPSAVNAHKIPLYPLLESMSGRVDLEMPDDVFRFGKNRMIFIDIASNTVNEQKSDLFTDMLLKKGVQFPVNIVAGNPTTRKEYDSGYLITDADNQLFHIKQTKGRPYVRLIEMPDGIEPVHIFVTEFKNKKILAFIADAQQRFWVLSTPDYTFQTVEIPPLNLATTSISIIANMFDWTITIKNNKEELVYAVNADDLSLIKSMQQPMPELTTAQKTGKYLFPVRLEFSSVNDNDIRPRIRIID